ncbi:MAG: toll/interleukin-1 receptor domain-containing protein [Mycobacterium sp.]
MQATDPGVDWPKLFLSYARQNASDIELLVQDLDDLGNTTWVDRKLRGGVDWWKEILRQITECDVFIAAITRDALKSVACQREREWAESLGKHILPVAVERLPKSLPRDFAGRQIIDYSAPDKNAVKALAGSLYAVPPPSPLPDPRARRRRRNDRIALPCSYWLRRAPQANYSALRAAAINARTPARPATPGQPRRAVRLGRRSVGDRFADR